MPSWLTIVLQIVESVIQSLLSSGVLSPEQKAHLDKAQRIKAILEE